MVVTAAMVESASRSERVPVPAVIASTWPEVSEDGRPVWCPEGIAVESGGQGWVPPTQVPHPADLR